MVRRNAVALAVALGIAAPDGRAEPIEHALGTARQIARAGAGVVSDDGAGALWLNPGNLVRQELGRVELGLALRDHEPSFAATTVEGPVVRDRAEPRAQPSALVAVPVGRFVLAAGYRESADHDHALPTAEPGQPAADVARLFPHRYAGSASDLELRTVMVGGAVRATDWLGVGLALHLTHAEVGERRTLWAGFAGRDSPGDPTRDLALAVSGSDPLVVGGALGLLIAPPELPLEVALAARGRAAVRATGSARLTAEHGNPFPAAEPGVSAAELDLLAPVALAAGVRYLGERVSLELSLEAAVVAARAARPRWRVEGVTAIDDSGARGELTALPSTWAQASAVTGRGALDVAVVDGFLWLVAGYAYAGPATPAGRLTAVGGDLGGHTTSLGAEASWDDITLVLGLARTTTQARRVGPEASEVALENPFGAAAGTAPANVGRHDASTNVVGLSVQVAWP